MSKNLRIYNVSDADLLQAAEVMVIKIPDDIESFTTFDSTIKAGYPSTIGAAIALAKSIPPDSQIVQTQAGLTQKLKKASAACYQTYQTIAFFVRKAYVGDIAMHKKFGLNEINKVRFNQNKFKQFIELLFASAEEHKQALIDKGCNENVFVALPLLLKTFTDAGSNQKKFKKQRGLITQQRIRNLNALFLLLKPLEEISANIFSHDPAKKKAYRLPHPVVMTKKRKKDEEESDEISENPSE